MSMFALATSYLTTSKLPWFMDLTFQVPMQYCSLQHQTLFPSAVKSTTGHCFRFGFGSVSWFFLELFLHSSPVALWARINQRSSSFSGIFFCLFILFMVLKARIQSALPFPTLVDHFCQNSPIRPIPLGWPIPPHGMAHSFIELGRLWSTWSAGFSVIVVLKR